MQRMQNGDAVIVSEPVMRPNRCAVVPHVSRDPEGFIDTGVKLPGFAPRVYVSKTGVRELAKGFGFPTPEQHEAAVARSDELERQVAELTGELGRLRRRLDAYEVLEADGVQVRAQPPAKPAVAVANSRSPRKPRTKETSHAE